MQWKHAEPELRKTEYEDCLYVLYIVQYSKHTTYFFHLIFLLKAIGVCVVIVVSA